jgi:hypothetical protein
LSPAEDVNAYIGPESENAHFADEFAEKKVDQLADEKNGEREDEPPHGSELVEHGNDDVCHDPKIQEERAVDDKHVGQDSRKGLQIRTLLARCL